MAHRARDLIATKLIDMTGRRSGQPPLGKKHLTVRRRLVALFWALALGLVLALSAGKTQQASVEIWVAAVAGWLAWMLFSEVVKLAPVLPERRRGVWTWRRATPVPPTRPRPLMVVEGLLLTAADNERAMAVRLRPRLAALTDHLLRTRHGIDAETRPDRAAAILGDLAWLVDPEAKPQTASLTDIDRLLAVLMVDEPRTPSDSNPTKAGAIDAG